MEIQEIYRNAREYMSFENYNSPIRRLQRWSSEPSGEGNVLEDIARATLPLWVPALLAALAAIRYAH